MKNPDLKIVLAFVSLEYAMAYLLCPATPGINVEKPLGWWGWFDQGQYLNSAKAMAQLDFSSGKHFYPPLYPLLGSFFVKWLPSHPFWLIDLVSLLWFVIVFIWLASLYVGRWTAIILLTLSVLVNYHIFGNFLIPWTSTVTAALLSSCIYGLIRLRNLVSSDWNSTEILSISSVFGVSILTGLIVPLRPVDAIVGGILWLGYMWQAWHILQTENIFRSKKIRPYFAVAVTGMLVGPAFFIGFNTLVHGFALGGYVHAGFANGYFIADLGEKFVSIFFDGYTLYLEPKSGLIDHYPWLILALLGICTVLMTGDRLLRLIALAICAQFILYLPYADLLPNGLWRYLNIHYFKWTFPYLALFGWLLGAFLIREWKESKRRFFVWAGFVVSTGVLLLSLRLQIDLHSSMLSSNVSIGSGSSGGMQTISLQINEPNTDMIDLAGLNGNFTDVYFGEHRLWIDGREFHRVRDFRVLPAPWGVRLLFIRPINAKLITFQPDPRLHLSDTEIKIHSGSYRFTLGMPKPFWDEKSAVLGTGYSLGETLYAN